MVKEDREENEDTDEEPLEKIRPLVETNRSRKDTKSNNPITNAPVDIDIDDDDNFGIGSSSSNDSNEWSEQKIMTIIVHRQFIVN